MSNIDKICNQDIIDFRHWLIDVWLDDESSQDNKDLVEFILRNFNTHFSLRGYDIGYIMWEK